MPASITFSARIMGDPDGSSMTAIELPFEPRTVFGKACVPVIVKIGGHTFRSTITNTGKNPDGTTCAWVPLRRSNREAAGVQAGDRVQVTLKLDTAERTVSVPADLTGALRKAKALKAFKAMSFSHRREHVEAVEDARKPETRVRRIDRCIQMVAAHAKARADKAAAKVKIKAKGASVKATAKASATMRQGRSARESASARASVS